MVPQLLLQYHFGPQNPKPQILGNETLSTKTPQKSEKFSGRARKGNVAISISDIRRAVGQKPQQVEPEATDGPERFLAQRKPKEETRWPLREATEKVSFCESQLYEILSEFFNGLDTLIRLLPLRVLKPSFSNICPQIECLTDRNELGTSLLQPFAASLLDEAVVPMVLRRILI
ncbi:hypothetical protein CerSpe_200530 [Prunus speciosa]